MQQLSLFSNSWDDEHYTTVVRETAAVQLCKIGIYNSLSPQMGAFMSCDILLLLSSFKDVSLIKLTSKAHTQFQFY